jgi:lysophospholipase L1-like esterase
VCSSDLDGLERRAQLVRNKCQDGALHALNFGIAGDSSGDLLKRLGRYSSLGTARAIFLEIGINDLLHATHDDIVTNYRRILAALPQQPRIYLIGILPIDEKAFVASYGNLASTAEIARLNAAARELCLRRGNCVALQPLGAGDLPPSYHDGDGLHLSQAGYDALTTALKLALAEP